MTPETVLRAAVRAKTNKDWQIVMDYKQEQVVELLLSLGSKEIDSIITAITQYHALTEFIEFVDALADEADGR